MCFQCRYNSEICDYHDSSAIFFLFFSLVWERKKKQPKPASFSPRLQILCLGPLIFSSIVVTALSLIHMSSIQLQPVCCSVGIQTQFLALHRNYFWNFKNTPSVTRCSCASCLPREDGLEEESEATTSPTKLIQCCLCFWPLFMHDWGTKEQPRTSPALGSGPRPAWRWEGGAWGKDSLQVTCTVPPFYEQLKALAGRYRR